MSNQELVVLTSRNDKILIPRRIYNNMCELLEKEAEAEYFVFISLITYLEPDFENWSDVNNENKTEFSEKIESIYGLFVF